VLETLQRSFVMYQRAMGIPVGLIVWKYVLRNSLISTVTQIGLLFGILLAGTVVIETVFQWPGIGGYAFEAILHSDYAAVMGFTIYAGVVFGIVNLIVDIGHAVLDPREAAA
jgi:peptide/nickel transport system permease protein